MELRQRIIEMRLKREEDVIRIEITMLFLVNKHEQILRDIWLVVIFILIPGLHCISPSLGSLPANVIYIWEKIVLYDFTARLSATRVL